VLDAAATAKFTPIVDPEAGVRGLTLPPFKG
jgi:hypothetical protein